MIPSNESNYRTSVRVRNMMVVGYPGLVLLMDDDRAEGFGYPGEIFPTMMVDDLRDIGGWDDGDFWD